MKKGFLSITILISLFQPAYGQLIKSPVNKAALNHGSEHASVYRNKNADYSFMHGGPVHRSAYSDTVQLITGPKILDDKFHRWRLEFIFDARQTLVSNTRAQLGGIRLGMEYRRVHRFGIGLYNLGTGVTVNSLEEVDTRIDTAILDMGYLSLFYERVYFFSPKWEFSLAAHQGFGTINGRYHIQGEDYYRKFGVQPIRPFEISTSGYYHFTWWLSAGGGIGYRFARGVPREVRPIYNAPVAIAKIRIRFIKLIRSIWNHEVKYEY